ncbi:short chain dehydrogenase/reductase [Aspergillus sclerotioniger CBS 115572]|uniref:Short chain dehydrogenase/reductase n=1 Tax=Aspergillus sclerotioniger CBS 115572 TaxID=1450535 RepID=A0A317V9W8_9EURO|nr:short chain dehydrogenase/reductase [Aspergillus sclerotioniger CBS 115572]PWY69828.1 short chain dehydrogenase/reductase [Aspergillus sclerotioniger CBS 115572]
MATIEDKRRSVLITGCSPDGIGNSLARGFHRNGLRVFAIAREAKTIEDLASIGIETSVRQCFAEVNAKLGEKGLDYLVINAGRNYTVPAIETELSEVRATFETNLFAIISICKTFLPLLMRAKGTIVQIGSVAGIVPYVFGSVYNASKAALHSFRDSLCVKAAPFGVTVTTVVTGGVQSRIARIQRTLAPNSIYAPIGDEYNRRVTHSQDGAMPNAAYARSVVTQVLYGSAPCRWISPWAQGWKSWIWEGNKSWVIWLFMGGWAWSGLTESIVTKMFKLHRLRRTR